jgi:hypothetical protein
MKKGIVMATIFSSLLGLFACNKTPTAEYKVADIYRDLRQQVFAISPSKIGISPTAPDQVWGVLMETGYPEAVATLVTVADGTVSLYFSNGGGIIGVGQHEGLRKACMEFLSFSQSFVKQTSPTKAFPLPARGSTRFYLLTLEGVRTAEFNEDDLGNNKLPLSPLFHKADEVITQARIVDERLKAKRGGAPDRR